MTIITKTITLKTRGNNDIINITDEVENKITKSNLMDGIITVFVSGSTAGVTTIEYESGVIEDLSNAIERMAPKDIEYKHDLRWGDGNGYSHVRAALLGPSLTVPFSRKRLMLGTWQQIVFIDFDNRSRTRELIVQIVGE